MITNLQKSRKINERSDELQKEAAKDLSVKESSSHLFTVDIYISYWTISVIFSFKMAVFN